MSEQQLQHENTLNYTQVRKYLWFVLFANLAVAAVKIAVGYIIKSSAVLSDGFHSITDASSNIVGIIGIFIASKPVDNDHNYGHYKYETLAGLVISGLLLLIGLQVLKCAVQGIINPRMPDISLISIISVMFTLFINIAICVFEYKKGLELNSSILISDSRHTRSDIYISIGVIITLISIKLGAPAIIDSFVSIVVAGFIFYACYEIYKDNSKVLLDGAMIDVSEVEKVVMKFDKVKHVHNIRSRGSKNLPFIDMHVMTEPDMNVMESHQLMHDIEDRMKMEINPNVQVIVHIEPYEG